ncbi:MAG: hypothetical protein ABIQ44_10605 [Chloroflexia bacterium]
MLVATLLHLDKFSKDTLAFNLWFGIYIVTPIWVPLLWFRNRRRDPHVLEAGDIVVPQWVRIASAVIGVGALAFALVLFALPQFGTSALNFWVWKLTPLTARVTAAAIAFPAVAWLMLARDLRWSAWRVPVEVQMVALGFTLLGIPRELDNFAWDRIATWLFVAVLVVLEAASIMLYIRMEIRRRAVVVGVATAVS